MRSFRLMVVMTGTVIAAQTYGSESSVYGGPIGGTDMRSAYVPSSPGFYVGAADVYGQANTLNGDNAKMKAGVDGVDFKVDVLAVAIQYVYPFKLFGGSIASSIQSGYAPLANFAINEREQHFQGWYDPYVDLLKWSKYFGTAGTSPNDGRMLPYGLTIQGAYSMIFPLGTYDASKYTSTGHNVYFFIPSLAATYLTQPNYLGDGLEVSGRFFVDYSIKNPTTQYKSGTVLDLDFAVSERKGNVQYGMAGFIAGQIDQDQKDDTVVAPNGKHYEYIKVGPLVAFDVPHKAITLKLKVTLPVYARNTVAGPQVVLSTGLKF